MPCGAFGNALAPLDVVGGSRKRRRTISYQFRCQGATMNIGKICKSRVGKGLRSSSEKEFTLPYSTSPYSRNFTTEITTA
jgi:hypothetical protein